MAAKILDGQLLAKELRNKLSLEIQQRNAKGLRPPGLAVILVGNDPASMLYVARKQQAAEEIGILSRTYNLPEHTSQQQLIQLITNLNQDDNVDGILIQLPLPSHINTATILAEVTPDKDVDGFHPVNMGKLAQGNPILRPCTPYGIMLLLYATKLPLAGAHAVIVGTSNIVGKPMAFELLKDNATVTICHKYTKELPTYVKLADILIVATGQANLITGSCLKTGAIVIDVGMNRLANGTIVGDVEFASAKKYASWITPVPKGVGPMTVAVLLQNTLLANKCRLAENSPVHSLKS